MLNKKEKKQAFVFVYLKNLRQHTHTVNDKRKKKDF